MAWLNDSLRSAISAAGRFNPFGRRDASPLGGVFDHQLAIAAYLSSGMMRKVISIPAEDRVREWRDWQAEKDDIEAIEKEERRLGLIAKVEFAEVLRGLGGGALILITAGNHAEPLNPETLRAGGLVAINAVSRWQIQGTDWVEDLADPLYGQPRMFRINGGRNAQDIHPSRVICFRGDPLPAGTSMSLEEAFWGDSRLLRVFCEVQRSDETQAWFSQLVKKAKLLRIGIGDLDDYLTSEQGQAKLASRVQLIAEGESTLNATVYRLGPSNGEGADRGEAISDYQINFAGIPAMMDAFDQRVAAVADIPFTRLMGRSPAGMNATGQYDDLNWVKAVTSGQNLELRPCLEMIDPILIRSAGCDPKGIWWKFAPLSAPTEKENADIFSTIMGAIEKLQATNSIPEREFAKGLQNLVIENGWLPGIDEDLKKLSDDERYGLSPDDDGTDPSELQAGAEPDNGGKEVDPTSPTARAKGGSRSPARAANDGKNLPEPGENAKD